MCRLVQFVVIAIFCLGAAASAQVISPLQADDHTLLLYHFDGDGAQVVDSGPLGLNGIVMQGVDEGEAEVVDAPNRVEGMVGTALSLAPRQAVLLDETPDELRGMDQLTVELWFRNNNENPTGHQRIVRYWEHYLVSIFQEGYLMGHLYDQDGEKYVLRGAGIEPNRWYHTALTWDGERARIWLNGRELSSVRMGGTINATPGSGLQLSATSGDWFEGEIDELRISNVAREAFPGARQYDFCRPSETLVLSPGTARMVFDPIVPAGVTSVECAASLGDVCEGSVTLADDAMEDYGDGMRLGHAEVVMELADGITGEMTMTGTVSYVRDGQPVSAEREFGMEVTPMVAPPAVEFRGAWTHSHRIEDPEDLFSCIAAGGLNAAVMRVRRGETAYYNSTLGPVSNIPFDNENLIEDCVAACKRHGIDLHCYVNNFPIGSPSSDYAQQMLAEGRWQKTAAGEDWPWMCPSQEENLQLVEDAMVELVRDYDIAGVQYDFIRYGRADVCFCDSCRAAFEERIGHAVENWPDDCLEGGPLYQEWMDQRADLITEAVRRTSAAVRAVDPDAIISAAVFAMPPEQAKMSVGQDWARWCREGLLDALCPMSYVASNTAWEDTVSTILDSVGEYLPVCAGIGLRSGQQKMRYPEQLAVKINMARELGAPGFNMFSITPPTDMPEQVLIPLRERMLPGDGRAEE